MKAAVTSLAVVVLSALLFAPTAKADHHEPSAWWKYLIGTWSGEGNDGGKSEATFKMAPAGKALICELRADNGWSMFLVMGHQGENEVGTGYGSNGEYSRTTVKLPIGDRHEGEAVGRGSEGNNWTGKYVSEKLSKDKFKWKFECKNEDGDREEFEFGATMTRKK